MIIMRTLVMHDVCLQYYKARIESITPGGGGGKKHVTVFFSDYGNRERVSFADIRELPDQTWVSDHHVRTVMCQHRIVN